MSLEAVVVGSGPASARLEEQLRSVGVETIVGRDAIVDGSGDLLVAYGDIVTQREALAGLVLDPRVKSGVLASERVGDSSWPLRTNRGRIESASSSFHSVSSPNGSFLGMLKVAASDRPALARIVGELSSLGLDDSDLPALLTVGLVRAGVPLSQSFIRELFWARVSSESELTSALTALESHDEERVLLDSAVKSTDGFFTTFFVSPYSKYIARWCARRGLTPNFVTSVSMLVGVLAAVAFALGTRAWLIVGAVLLQAAFTLDCVDGQLARYTRTFTSFGAWLDSVFDRAKEYVVYAGLAIGASRHGDPVWALAGAALTLQTTRHMLDFSWAASEHAAIAVVAQRPLSEAWDGYGAEPAEPVPALAVSTGAANPGSAPPPRPTFAKRALSRWNRLNRLPGILWIKRIAAFPIGERFATISVTAALFTPRTTFTVLLVAGGFAALYGLAGRLLRSLR